MALLLSYLNLTWTYPSGSKQQLSKSAGGAAPAPKAKGKGKGPAMPKAPRLCMDFQVQRGGVSLF